MNITEKYNSFPVRYGSPVIIANGQEYVCELFDEPLGDYEGMCIIQAANSGKPDILKDAIFTTALTGEQKWKVTRAFRSYERKSFLLQKLFFVKET